MAIKIEDLIYEIEDFINDCKYQKFSKDENIIVNKSHIEELLLELRENIPSEVRKSQKLIKQKEEILQDATQKKDVVLQQAKNHAIELIKQAEEKVSQLTNETEVMENAIRQADEMVAKAGDEAVKIYERAIAETDTMKKRAVAEVNEMQSSVIQYVDSMLQEVERIIDNTLRESLTQYSSFESSLNKYKDVISSNRMELLPPMDDYLQEVNTEDDETDS